MKRFKWWLIGSMAVGLGVVLLTGCIGIPQSEFEALQADYGALQAEHATLADENTSLKAQSQTAQSDLTNKQADYDALNADYEAVNEELTEIKGVYPPRAFSSLSELRDWLEANDVADKPVTPNAEDWYGRAIEVQEDALKDGYIVSVDYDYYEEEDLYDVWCVTIINGDVWYWDPETDEPIQDYGLGKVK